MLAKRYGKLEQARCLDPLAGLPGRDLSAVPYQLHFEKMTVEAQVQLTDWTAGLDAGRPVALTLKDPKAGAIPFPPPARTAAADASKDAPVDLAEASAPGVAEAAAAAEPAAESAEGQAPTSAGTPAADLAEVPATGS